MIQEGGGKLVQLMQGFMSFVFLFEFQEVKGSGLDRYDATSDFEDTAC